MNRRLSKASWISIAFLLLFASNAVAQTKEIHSIKSLGGATCEAVAASMDIFAQHTKPEKTIIVISYLGKNETRKGLETQRINTIRSYFTDHLRNTPYARKKNSVILARAAERADEGRLDFYVDGAIEFRINFYRNSFLAVSACVDPGT